MNRMQFFFLLLFASYPLMVFAETDSTKVNSFCLALVVDEPEENSSSDKFQKLGFYNASNPDQLWVSRDCVINATALADASIEFEPELTDKQINEIVKSTPQLTEESIREYANLSKGPQLFILLNQKGATKVSKFTFDNVKRKVAWILDDKILSAPLIVEGIPKSIANNISFGTLGSEQEVTQIVNQLKAMSSSR